MKKKISVIFGTRPEAIKLCPVVLALKADPAFDCRVCVTGQHREMLQQVLDVFGVVPDVDLALMQPNQTLAGLTARAMTALDDYLAKEKPDIVMVQGDTTTVLCGALAAFYHHIPVAHVEAGLRTGNLYSPWPEEANRLLTTRLTKWHFCPTENNKNNLLREGVNPSDIYVVGNTVIDALLLARDKISREDIEPCRSVEDVAGAGELGPCRSVEDVAGKKRRSVLITGHRRENFGDGFEHICTAIKKLALEFPDTDFIYPVHLNPNVREPVERILGTLHSPTPTQNSNPSTSSTLLHGQPTPTTSSTSSTKCAEEACFGGNIAAGDPKGAQACALKNIHLIAPQSYLPFVRLMMNASIILTDSGGVQEEAPSLGKPVLVMRDTTERPEAVTAGTVKIVGTTADAIYENARLLLTDKAAYDKMSNAVNPYGDGKSVARIVDILKR